MKRAILAVGLGMALSLSGCGGGHSVSLSEGGSGTPTPKPDPVTGKTYYSPLLAAFDFEYQTGDTVPDGSGNKLDLLNSGCTLAAGKVGLGLDCGDAGYAATPKLTDNFAAQLARKGALSVQFWFKYRRNAGQDYLLHYDGAFSAYLKGNRLYFSPDGVTEVALGSDLSPDTWYNAAFTYDGRAARLYLDGALAVTQAMSTPPGAGSGSDTNLKIAPTLGGSHFQGVIDSLRIHDVVLTDTQIRTGFEADNSPGV